MPRHQDEDTASINASLKDVSDKLANHRTAMDQRLDGLQADLQSMQQTFAAGAQNLGAQFSAGPSVGTRAADAIITDPSFAAARDQAERNMKVSQFSARANIDASIKAALTNEGKGNTGDTSVPSQPERRGAFGPVLPPLRLLDVLPSRRTTSDAVEFIQFSGGSDEAAEQEHEGDEKAELEFQGTAVRAEIVTIAGWTTASKQVVADLPALKAQIDRVIRHKVLSKLEDRLVNGVGGQGKINGLWNQATPLVPTIGETPADMIGESLVTMANAGYAPSVVLMNPMDWFRLQITRKNDTDDEYVFGSPTTPAPPSLWNTRIVPMPSMAQRRVLTIDTSMVTVLDREQLSVVLSNAHADYFVRNLVAILAEMRAGLEILDTGAVRKFELPAITP